MRISDWSSDVCSSDRVMPEHGAESAWVVQKKTGVAENPFGVVMFTAIFVGRSSAQGTGHAQMDDLRAMIEIDQQVLAPAFAANYLPAVDPVGQVGGNGPAHARLVNHKALEHMAGHNRRYSATCRFDFW